MENTKLFVVDNQKMITHTIKEYLKEIPDLEILLSANEIEEDFISNNMILFNILIPKEEGIHMIEYLKDHHQILEDTLHKLGVPSHLKGYQYLIEGIKIMKQERKKMKEIYLEISQKYQTTISNIERAIRNAIEISWNRGDWDTMEEFFGNSIDLDKAKPTNYEYIVTISERMK